MSKELTLDKLRTLKAQGKSDTAIAKKFSVSVNTVRSMREQHGIPALQKRAGYKRKDIDKRYAECYPIAKQMRIDGHTFAEIESATGVSQNTVRGWLSAKRFKKKVYDLETMLELVYEYLVWYKYHHNGNTPVASELADGIGCAHSSVDKYIDILVRRGRIAINKGSSTIKRIDIIGGQWLPPSGVKVPSTPRKKQRQYKPRRDKAAQLRKVGRLCECGQEAKWVSFVRVGSAINEGGRLERMPLCDDCAEYEREIGGDVQPIDEVQT